MDHVKEAKQQSLEKTVVSKMLILHSRNIDHPSNHLNYLTQIITKPMTARCLEPLFDLGLCKFWFVCTLHRHNYMLTNGRMTSQCCIKMHALALSLTN